MKKIAVIAALFVGVVLTIDPAVVGLDLKYALVGAPIVLLSLACIFLSKEVSK